jgi:hypothetical protein
MKKTPSSPQRREQAADKPAAFLFFPKEKTLIKRQEAVVETAGALKSLSILRTVALSLVAVMLVQDVVWAYPDMARPAASVPAAASAPRPVNIPQSMGRIEDTFASGAADQPLIVNIRDAHRKLDSQYSINRLLEHLADKYQLGFVAMEGASGPVHTGLLAAFPDKASRDSMAEGLLRKGRLSASEYFAVTSGREVRLYGAEDNGLYDRNRRLFGRILQLSTAARSLSRRMETRLDREAPSVLGPDALAFRSARSEFRRRLIPLDVYMEKVRALAVRSGDPALLVRHPHAARYLRLLKTEKRLDFEKVDAERKALLRTLRTEHSELAPNLARLSADYASKKIDHAEFFRRLWQIARSRGADMRDHAALRSYVRYWAEFGRLDLYGVWSDLEAAEKQLETRLSDSSRAEDFFRRDAERLLISKLVTLGLSAEEYRKLRRDPRLEVLQHAVRPSERRVVRAALAFYAVAERRNRSILTNTLRRMERDGVRTAALVTGGFHSEGLSELMRSDKVSHLIVMPSFDPDTGDRPYVTVLTQRPAEWEKRLAGDDLYLAAPAWIGRAPSTIGQAEPLLAELLAARRAQGRPDFTAADIEAYVAAYEALHVTDPGANPLRPADLKKLLARVRNVRRVAPDRMQVMIGEALWEVTVDASGQPVGTAPAAERPAPVIDLEPLPVTTARVELDTPRMAARPDGRPRQSAFESVVPVRPAAPVRGKFRTVEPESVDWLDEPAVQEAEAPALAAARLSVTPGHAFEAALLALSVLVPGLGWLLPAWIAVRGMNLTAFLLHNSGHKLAEMLVRPEALRVVSAREGVSWNRLLLSVLPFMPLPQELARSVELGADGRPGSAGRWIAAGGQLASAASAAAGLLIMRFAQDAGVTLEGWQTAFLAAWTAVSASTAVSLPDWRTLLGRANAIACGPGFAILWTWMGNVKIFDKRMQDIMRILMKFSSRRGGQSGGASIKAQMMNNPVTLLDKLVKGKRSSITSVLLGSLYKFARKMERRGYKAIPGIIIALFHLRYATGGRTNWDNTQPLWHRRPEWVMHFTVVEDKAPDASAVKAHSGRGGLFGWWPRAQEPDGPQRRQGPRKAPSVRVRPQATVASTTVGHNGDMDAVDREDGKPVVEVESVEMELNTGGYRRGRTLTQGEARTFFKTAMPDSSSKGTSDSKTIAEWFDYHMTQGILSRSLLQAWYSSVADVDQVLSGTFRAPDTEQWEKWEYLVFEEVSNLLGRKDALAPGSSNLSGATAGTRRSFREVLRDRLGDEIPGEFLESFLALAERAFFDQNLEWCLARAAATFRGTFAMMVYSTLEQRVGIFALTQSFSFGVNETRGELIGSAEPMGVTAALGSGDPEDVTRQTMLKHGQFAVLEASAEVGIDQAIRIYDAHTAYHPGPWHPPMLARNKWFPATQNSKIKIPVMDNIIEDLEDETGQALRDIPVVVEANRESFLPGGENAAAMTYLRSLVRQIAQDAPRGAHIIFHGMDYNYHLARQLKALIEKDAPYLAVLAKDSSQVLDDFLLAIEKHKAGVSVPELSGQTIVIAITNSAQTQTVLSAQRKAIEYFSLLGQPAPSAEDPGHVFVLTEQLFNSASAMLGQEYSPEDPVLPTTFQNFSNASVDAEGNRVWRARFSEAASAEIAATQAALMEIRMGITEELLDIAERTGVRPFALQDSIDKGDVAAFREAQLIAYQQEVPDRIIQGGIHDDDRTRPAAERELVAEAKYRARNVTEWLNAEMVFLFYLFVLAPLGLQPFKWAAVAFGAYVGGVLGGFFAVFLVWGFALFVRKFIYKAPVLDRLMGPRSELFLDEGYVGVMLERFNRTLFSLSYGFLGVNFWGGDSIKEGLHRFVSGAYRGFVTVHRVGESEDGVFAAKRAKENVMVVKQYVMNKTNGGQAQAHVKVRGDRGRAPFHPEELSENPPPLIYLTDRMEAFRDKHMVAEGEAGLSMNAWNWIGELHDMTDGLIAEMSISHHRVALVSGWAERWLVRIFGKRIGVALARLFGVHQLWRWDNTYPQTRTASTESPRGADFPNVVTAGYRWKQRIEGVAAKVFRRQPKAAPAAPAKAADAAVVPGLTGRAAKTLGYAALLSTAASAGAGWVLFKYLPELAASLALQGQGFMVRFLDPQVIDMIGRNETAATVLLSLLVGAAVLVVIIASKVFAFGVRQFFRFTGWVADKFKNPLPDPFPLKSPEFRKFKARYPDYVAAALKGDRAKPALPALQPPAAAAQPPVPAPPAPRPVPAPAPRVEPPAPAPPALTLPLPAPVPPVPVSIARQAPAPAAEPVIAPALISAPAPAPVVLPASPTVWKLQVLLSGRVRAAEDKLGGRTLLFDRGADGKYRQPGQPVEAELVQGAVTEFVISENGQPIGRAVLNANQELSLRRFVSGARLAVPALEGDAPRIGVLIRDGEQRKEWMRAWQAWSGRAADPDRFLFWIADGPDNAAAAERLRSAGVSWVVDATDGIGSMPDWMQSMELSGTGAESLLRQVIGKMLSAPSADLWTAEDWTRLAELSERALPEAAPARLLRSGAGLAVSAAIPARVDAAEALELLQDVDRKLAEAMVDARLANDPGAALELAGEWARVLGRFRALFARNAAGGVSGPRPAPFRTPFAASDPSYQQASAVRDAALLVTDLEVFAKDGGLPYRMRVENLERASEGLLTSALLVRDPDIRSREALLREHPEADVFGDRIIFASSFDAAERIADAAAGWGMPGVPAVWIAPQTAADSMSAGTQDPNLWTVALKTGADTTIGILETAARLLSDPDTLQPGLEKRSVRKYVYNWPKAVPVDYRRLVESLRASRTSA